MNEPRKKVILDVDTGTDDALAILMALTDPGLEVIGITVTQGNQPLENCVDNTLRVVDLLGADVPVYAGCSAPMVRSLSKGRMAQNPENVVSAEVDGKPVILHPPHLDLPAPHSKPQQMHACSYLVETLRRSEEKVTIIPVGPPTNVGMAFRMAPDLKDHVEEVVFMGGAVDRGNITPVGEANFVHDPEAAKIVLDSGVNCRVITLNATHSAEMTRADADKILALGTPAAKFVGELMKGRILVGETLGWTEKGEKAGDALHDALAVAAVIDPGVITDLRRQKCDMDIAGGAADGQLVVEHRNENDESVNTWVAYRADKPKFFEMLYRHVEAAGRL